MNAWKAVSLVFWLALPGAAVEDSGTKAKIEELVRRGVLLESLDGGRIRIQRERRTATVDLAQEISGCGSTGLS